MLHRTKATPWFQYSFVEEGGPVPGEKALCAGGVVASADADEFLDRWLYDFQCGRVEFGARLLAPMLTERNGIFSLASGTCAIEGALSQQLGAKIECSDIERLEVADEALRLFPGLTGFHVFDAVRDQIPSCRAVLCFGLTSLLDNDAFQGLLSNAANALPRGGHIYLEICVSQSLAARMFHNWYMPFEAATCAFIKGLMVGRKFVRTTRHHGYFHTKDGVVNMAAAVGFRLVATARAGGSIDLRRSALFSRLWKLPGGKALVRLLGAAMPYLTVLKLERV